SRGRALRELVGRREEEALERMATKSTHQPLPGRGSEVGAFVQPRHLPALVLRDLVDGVDARRHVRPGESLRKDDLEGLRRRRDGRCPALVTAVADACDRKTQAD